MEKCDRCGEKLETTVKGEIPWYCHACEAPAVQTLDAVAELPAWPNMPVPVTRKQIEALLKGKLLHWYDGEYFQTIKLWKNK